MSPPETVFHRVSVSPAPTARREPSHVNAEQRRGSERYEPTERQRQETEGSAAERAEELGPGTQTLKSPSREVVTAMRAEGWNTRDVTAALQGEVRDSGMIGRPARLKTRSPQRQEPRVKAKVGALCCKRPVQRAKWARMMACQTLKLGQLCHRCRSVTREWRLIDLGTSSTVHEKLIRTVVHMQTLEGADSDSQES